MDTIDSKQKKRVPNVFFNNPYETIYDHSDEDSKGKSALESSRGFTFPDSEREIL